MRLTAQLLLLVLAASARAQAADATADSPFLPRTTAASPVEKAGAEAYVLSGYVANGRGGLLSVTRTADKRSFWIPVGNTVEDITAVSYDPQLDQAVIRVAGQALTIALRKAAAVQAGLTPAPIAATSSAVSPGPAAVSKPDPNLPPQPPLPAPGTPAFAEREARMLVTDLLEIGLEQRKAYEAAQREAAARGARAPRAEAATPQQR